MNLGAELGHPIYMDLAKNFAYLRSGIDSGMQEFNSMIPGENNSFFCLCETENSNSSFRATFKYSYTKNGEGLRLSNKNLKPE